MEPKIPKSHGSLEDDFHFQLGDVLCSILIFRAVCPLAIPKPKPQC